MLRVGDGDDAVEAIELTDLLVNEEGLRDGSRVGEAGRLDDHRVELRDLRVEVLERHHEVAADGAANAAIHHLDHLLVRLLREDLLVDADLAKLHGGGARDNVRTGTWRRASGCEREESRAQAQTSFSIIAKRKPC